MRILFVVPYAPTPVRTRPYNLVRTLARRDHALTIATLWENERERAALKQFENQGIDVIAVRLTKPRSAWNCIRALPTGQPLQSVYCWQPELLERMPKAASSTQRPFDVIHVEHLRGARYGLHSPISNLQSPVVWDSVDCISYLFEQAAHNRCSGFGRLVTRFDLPRTKKYEAWLVNQFDRVLVTSPIDAAAFAQLANGRRRDKETGKQGDGENKRVVPMSPCPPVSVLPNGVDLDCFSPSHAPREPATVVFSGKMSYHANVTAALHLVHDIMPLVWRERPNVLVKIVGQDPPSQVSKLAGNHLSPATKSALSQSKGRLPPVTVTGRVPDLRPYLQSATLAVAPMFYGAGIQNKVLEAMACATPVVATSQAVSALQACPDEHLLLADETAAFARQILRLLDDQDLQRRMGQAGRRYVEQHHDWDRIVEHLEEIYRELVD